MRTSRRTHRTAHRSTLTRKLQVTAASVAAAALFAGVATAEGQPAAHQARVIAASPAHLGTAQLAAFQAPAPQPKFHNLNWDVDGGLAAWVRLINELRALNSQVGGHRDGPYITGNRNSKQAYVDVTDNQATLQYARIHITTQFGESNGPVRAITLVVRLSDFYVVGWYTTMANRLGVRGQYSHAYVPLANDFPFTIDILEYHKYTTFLGKENYNQLATLANQSPENVTISAPEFQGAVNALSDPVNFGTRVLARALLQMIIGISEAARFRPMAGGIARNFEGVTVPNGVAYQVGSDIGLMRNWQKLSNLYNYYRTRPNQTSTSQSVTIEPYGLIDNLRSVVTLIMIALAPGPNPNPKDEL